MFLLVITGCQNRVRDNANTGPTLDQITISFNNLLVNEKLAFVNINVADLLNGNYILLLFVVLALGFVSGNFVSGQYNLVIPLAF
jgi:putative transport protein